jgi:hypothetical protein
MAPMTDHISLEVLDPNGDVQQAAEDAGIDRKAFMRKGAIAGAGFIAGGVAFNGLISPAAAQSTISKRKSAANDVKIGNYALTLEYLEAAFYAAALQANVITDPRVLKFAQVVGQHEADHVAALKKLLGRAAVASPRFDFSSALGSEASFKTTAQALEDTGVAAYAGQAPYIKQFAIIRPALGIHSVEARHAAWIRFLNGGGEPTAAASAAPAPKVVDAPLGQKTVLRAVTALNFIKG